MSSDGDVDLVRVVVRNFRSGSADEEVAGDGAGPNLAKDFKSCSQILPDQRCLYGDSEEIRSEGELLDSRQCCPAKQEQANSHSLLTVALGLQVRDSSR